MNKIRLTSLILLFLLIVSVFSGLSFAEDRSYSIPDIKMDLYLEDNGTLHVKEILHYSFKGTYNGIYRDIPINGNQSLQNIRVAVQGAYSAFNVSRQGNMEHITVYLYDDPQKKTQISNKDVYITIDYDFLYAIKFYNDIAELQYKLIGENWNVDIGKLNAAIHFKSDNGIEYWLNPFNFAKYANWSNNTFLIETEKNTCWKIF